MMDIRQIEVTVGEVCEGYFNDAEEGVVGYDERLDIRPRYQREFVYTGKQRDEVIRTVMKGLPLAYNKDLQEDKEGALDTAHTLMQCLSVMAGMISTWTVNEDAMARECGVGHLDATDVADYLAKRGLPFREAHAVVGHLVLMCEKRGCNLEDLPFEVFQEASPLFEHDITEALDIPSIVAARTTEGGTAPAAVAVQLQRAEAQLVVDEGVFGSLTKVVEMGHGAK